jgi:probable phosphoglycerate mutase
MMPLERPHCKIIVSPIRDELQKSSVAQQHMAFLTDGDDKLKAEIPSMSHHPQIYLARHGETAWTVSGQHTGLTDIPLTERGERNARRLGERLKGLSFAHVFTSPLRRAARTCELAGFGAAAKVDPHLVEWNYGAYEGKTTAEIVKERPGWEIFRDGCPGGESPMAIAARADGVVTRLRALTGDVLLFSSSHFLRVFAPRWCRLDISIGRVLYLGTATLSIVGYLHNLTEPAIRLWNDARHVGE